MRFGISAIAKILYYYQSHYNLDTLAQFINKYAPPNENNTTLYVTNALTWVNSFIDMTDGYNSITENTPLNLSDDLLLTSFIVHAIIRQEHSVLVDIPFINFSIANY